LTIGQGGMSDSDWPGFASEPETGKITPKHHSPRRVTITVPYALYCELLARSDQQGRSLSNLAAFLLEAAISSS